MKFRYIIYILLLCLGMAMTACDDSGNESDSITGVSRTVLVYMVADNSLGRWDNDKADLSEMRMAAAAGDLNGGRLIVYYNRPGTDNGNAPQLLEITADGDRVIKTYPDDPSINSLDVERMAEVFSDMKRIAPADDYGLVLWSHANGWMETQSSRSFGQERSVTMKISSLAKALKGNEFSFIYFDCCSMASIEVMWELREFAPVMVASGTELPANGMPYHLTLSKFFASGEPDMVSVANTTFGYYDSMTDVRRTCTMTVVNTRALEPLARATADIMEDVVSFPEALGEVQPYFRDAIRTYMYDFEQYIETLEPDATKLAAWRAALADAVVYAKATPTLFCEIDLDRYCGLGTYVIRDTREITLFNYSERAWYRDVVSCSPLLDININI